MAAYGDNYNVSITREIVITSGVSVPATVQIPLPVGRRADLRYVGLEVDTAGSAANTITIGSQADSGNNDLMSAVSPTVTDVGAYAATANAAGGNFLEQGFVFNALSLPGTLPTAAAPNTYIEVEVVGGGTMVGRLLVAFDLV